jgi:hypothetical protein
MGNIKSRERAGNLADSRADAVIDPFGLQFIFIPQTMIANPQRSSLEGDHTGPEVRDDRRSPKDL